MFVCLQILVPESLSDQTAAQIFVSSPFCLTWFVQLLVHISEGNAVDVLLDIIICQQCDCQQ